MTDDLKQRFNEAILDHGHGVQYVPAGTFPDQQRPLAYTVGRTLRARPELVLSGPFDARMAAEMLQNLIDVDDYEALEHGTPVRVDDDGPLLMPVTVHTGTLSTQHLLCSAIAVFGKVEALQLLWGDDDGRFPGDPECTIPIDSQDIL